MAAFPCVGRKFRGPRRGPIAWNDINLADPKPGHPLVVPSLWSVADPRGGRFGFPTSSYRAVPSTPKVALMLVCQPGLRDNREHAKHR